MLQRFAMNSRVVGTASLISGTRRFASKPPKLTEVLKESSGEDKTRSISEWRKKFLPIEFVPVVVITGLSCLFGVYVQLFILQKPLWDFSKKDRKEISMGQNATPYKEHMPTLSLVDVEKARHMNEDPRTTQP